MVHIEGLVQWRDVSVFLLAAVTACSAHASHNGDSHNMGGRSGAPQAGDLQEDGSITGADSGGGPAE